MLCQRRLPPSYVGGYVRRYSYNIDPLPRCGILCRAMKTFCWLMMLLAATVALAKEKSATLQAADKPLNRPTWMDDEGIIMAGNWEEPAFRARRLGRMDFRLPSDLLAGYEREHSQAMLDELKRLGVNFVMIHGYKGFGFDVERPGMQDAKKFAALAHKNGMRVGVYIGGTLGYESLFKEIPEAKQWQCFGPKGEALYYNEGQKYRYAAVRHHPGYNDYLKRPVRFAVEEMKADLVHFDNFGTGGATWDEFSVRGFQEFLLQRGVLDTFRIRPPAKVDLNDPIGRAWQDYRCVALTSHYREMSRYIRSVNPQCAVECNPGGVRAGGAMARGVDHAQLLPLGNAYWDESWGASWTNNRPVTRIRSLLAGQTFGNSTFLYSETPLDIAESMAFNVNCLGCIAWFEYGKIVSAHVGTTGEVNPAFLPYIEFFKKHTEFYRHATPAPDVAVLRTHATFAYGPAVEVREVYDAEQALIESQTPFAMLYDETLGDLANYKAVITPAEVSLTTKQNVALDDFRARGGEVLKAGLLKGDPQRARERLAARLRVQVTAPPAVAVAVTEQRAVPEVLVHLVNYNAREPVKNVPVTVRARRLTLPLRVEYWNPLQPKPVTLEVKKAGSQLQFTVPQVDVYGLIVVRGALL